MTALDVTAAGPDEDAWLAHVAELPRWPVPARAHVVVVSPHPDDETLGVGGTLHHLGVRGARVDLVAVTDGEASHPAEPALGARRRRELRAGLQRLGVLSCTRLHHLGVPDGAVADHAHRVRAAVLALAGPGSVVLGPHPDDGHGDHDVAGRVTAEAAREAGTDAWAYPVWAWHWHDPATSTLLDGAHRVPLGAPVLARKRRAAAAFTSQLTDELGPPVVPPDVLPRLLRPDEVLVPTCA